MSYAVSRELAADPAMRRWSSWSPDGREIPPAVTALPSVAEFSRFSLISGNRPQPPEELGTIEPAALLTGKQKIRSIVASHHGRMVSAAKMPTDFW
jgi:hypothetical protein